MFMVCISMNLVRSCFQTLQISGGCADCIWIQLRTTVSFVRMSIRLKSGCNVRAFPERVNLPIYIYMTYILISIKHIRSTYVLSSQYFVRVHVFRKYTSSTYIIFLYSTYECCSTIILHYLFYHTQHKYTLLYNINYISSEIYYYNKSICIGHMCFLD